MKFIRLFALALIASFGFASVANASALTVSTVDTYKKNFFGNYVLDKKGKVVSAMTGPSGSFTIDTYKAEKFGDMALYDYVRSLSATLDAKSTMTITLTATGVGQKGAYFLERGSSTDYTRDTLGEKEYKTPKMSALDPTVISVKEDAPAFVFAGTAAGGSKYFTLSQVLTLSNLTGVSQSFDVAYLRAIIERIHNGSLTVSYLVTSNVPLPSSVLLFASAMMVLAGFAAHKKARGQI